MGKGILEKWVCGLMTRSPRYGGFAHALLLRQGRECDRDGGCRAELLSVVMMAWKLLQKPGVLVKGVEHQGVHQRGLPTLPTVSDGTASVHRESLTQLCL